MADAPTGMTVELSAPELAPLRIDARAAILPGAAGVITLLPGHTPLLTQLTPGVVVVTGAKGEESHYAIKGGFAEVKDNRLLVLTDLFEPGDEIKIDHAEEELERARERLAQAREALDIVRAELAVAHALARVSAHHGQGYD